MIVSEELLVISVVGRAIIERPMSYAQRAALFLAGIFLAAAGFGLPAMGAWDAAHGDPVSPVVAVLVGCPCLVVGCVGLDLAMRAPRGTPLRSGLLHRLLAAGRRRSWFRPATVTVGVPLVCGLLVALAATTHDAEGLMAAECAGAGWFAYVVNVLVHELGHLLAVGLLGLAPQRVVVLPFDFYRTMDGWHVRLGQEWFVLSGGMVTWRANGQPSPLQMIVFAGAGPAASFLLLLLYLVLNPYGWAVLFAYQPGPVLILIGIFAALVTVAGNLIPVRVDPMSGYSSDGFVIRQNLARLRKDAASAPAFLQEE